MSIDFTWLEEHLFNQQLDDAQKEMLASKMDVLEYSVGNTIVKQGSIGQALYIIYSGHARIECECNGETIQVHKVSSGDLVGEMSFLTASETSASVIASDDCVTYKFPRDAFTDLMKNHQELAYAVFAHLLSHTANVIRHMNEEKAAIQHYMAGSRF